MAFHSDLDKYSRQVLFGPLGEAGQRKLLESGVLVIGCGALGSTILELLARTGIGRLRFVDRDFVEVSNLQRQALYTESDARNRIPKAIAAESALRMINSEPVYEPRVTDVNHSNVEELAAGMDIILDGTDNFETRFLINEVAVKHSLPYIYGACVGSTGVCMPVIPGRTPCLRCILPEIPGRGVAATCDTAGIINPIARIVSSLEVALAMKILAAGPQAVEAAMVQVDCWEWELMKMDVTTARNAECPVCGRQEFPFLAGENSSTAVSLCGRNMVQINFTAGGMAGRAAVDFAGLAARLGHVGPVVWDEYLLTFRVDELELILFPDGRCLVKGTDDLTRAKNAYARYIGF